MKLHRITFYDADEGACLSWRTNKQDAERELRALQKARGDKAQGPEGVEAVDIPTDKAGLCAWLNENFTRDNG